ncbi:putative phosphocholine cytidylyltransferase [Aliarcobacter faecis]|uniref:DUF6564 domain-containing protein n=1 Tax=Aliarcobacter faecis TaxID=1564138 RepID=UPI0004B92266|nr:DUF6564 domain-containing protein [Aliarcobacter faecis]QKF72294.1 putative phosphocholine cytidylyltransferase [Aliarcobacter faecis]
MNRAIIITIAGESKRFRKSINKDILKSMYKEEEYPSILDILLNYSLDLFDTIVIVGGYKFDELESYINSLYNDKIVLVKNSNYMFGSNESLLCGIRALDKKYDEVLFIEGDLIIDKNSFQAVVDSKKNVITYNTEQIDAKTSVIFYINTKNKIVYKYDTGHEFLEINEPFVSIKNSAQIWKFIDFKLLKKISAIFTQENLNYTNLETIDKYFSKIETNLVDFIKIRNWYNCNTIDNYKQGVSNEFYK